MKKLLLAMFVALLMVGCGEEALNAQTSKNEPGLSIDLDDNETLEGIIAEAIDVKTLRIRDKKEGEKLAHAPNQETPYTGWAKGIHANGQTDIFILLQLKNGKRDGLMTQWYENGQKQFEGNFKDGKLMTSFVWKPNGKKCPVTNVKNGNGVSVGYYENGQKQGEVNYKGGKLMTVVAWKPNGDKCPVTKLIDGNGVALWYKKDGTEEGRETYKDGIKVR